VVVHHPAHRVAHLRGRRVDGRHARRAADGRRPVPRLGQVFGADQPEGTYYYELVLEDGRSFTGTVTLLR